MLRACGELTPHCWLAVLAVLAVVLGLTSCCSRSPRSWVSLAFRLYRIALRLLLPRPVDVRRAIKGEMRRRRRSVRRVSRHSRGWRARARRRLSRGVRVVLR
jgi:heme exporter protein D